MYHDSFGRQWFGPFAFTASGVRQHAPSAQGVYQVLHVDKGQTTVAYIGIATGATIRGRLQKHVSGRGNWALGRLTRPAEFRFVYFPCDTETAKQIESHVVTQRKPPFNVRSELQNFIPSIAVH